MDLLELAGKVHWPARLLRKGLSADVLDLVVGQFDYSSNALVSAVLPAFSGRGHGPESQQ